MRALRCPQAVLAVSGAPSSWWEQGDKQGLGAAGAGPAGGGCRSWSCSSGPVAGCWP